VSPAIVESNCAVFLLHCARLYFLPTTTLDNSFSTLLEPRDLCTTESLRAPVNRLYFLPTTTLDNSFSTLLEPRDLCTTESLRAPVNRLPCCFVSTCGRSVILERCLKRLEWDRARAREVQELEDEAERERQAMQQVRQHGSILLFSPWCSSVTTLLGLLQLQHVLVFFSYST
jgi:hypothetical protein